jgi:hypothetical protein
MCAAPRHEKLFIKVITGSVRELAAAVPKTCDSTNWVHHGGHKSRHLILFRANSKALKTLHLF